MTKDKNSKDGVTIIGGAGHIGLPFGVAFALAGVPSVLFDINAAGLTQIKSGVFPFKEKDGPESLRKALDSGLLTVTTNSEEAIRASKYIVLVIGTPIDEYLNPDFRGIMKMIDGVADYFVDGQILILRSTVYPGTSERLQKYFNNKGKKVHIAFCPERIVEGRALEELKSLPQIISSFNKETEVAVTELFRKLTDRKIIPVLPAEAELAKLFSNAWRYMTFAIGNQFYMIAKDHGLDYHNIYKAMTEDYPRNKDLPRPGFAAGPCLLKDTMQLAAYSNNNFFLGHAAMLVNEGLPNYILQQLKETHPDLSDKTIGILGMTFKAESDDIRDSLSYKLKKIAGAHSKEVLCHDYFLSDDELSPLEDVLSKSDVIILATPHSAYKEVVPANYPDKVFVDVWRFW